MSKVIRSVKNVTKGYSGVQVKVREATSNDPWGPTGTQMSEIAQLTYNSSTEFYDIVDMLDKRLNDKGKNWRHVLKALKVLDYCLHEGSELIVTWARKNIYIIKTLREFMYMDEDGRDVGQNVRVAAKELTALIMDEERLRAERSDRKTWKSRVTGIEEYSSEGGMGAGGGGGAGPSQPRRARVQRQSSEDDLEYKLAIEASKNQEEEDLRKRQGRQGTDVSDDDLAKAIQLSREEDERRKQELENANAASLFDDDPVQLQQPVVQPQYTNMGYQQGSNVDWLGNPIDQNQAMQQQYTGMPQMGNNYTGFQQQQTGFSNGFDAQQTGMYNNPYSQQMQQPQQTMQIQPTGYNPYGQGFGQQQQQQQQVEPAVQAGSNNPWATGSMGSNNAQPAIQPMKTGSNNPFAAAGRPQTARPPAMPNFGSLQSLPEQKSLQTFTPPPAQSSLFNSPPPQQQQQQPFKTHTQNQKPMTEHEQRLNALLATGDGMDTFGNTGEMRIPSQHTAPGIFVNSAGIGAQKLTAVATGNNPFLRQQFTGMPTPSYGQPQMPAATGPVGGMNAGYGGGNPFAGQQQQNKQQQGGGDLIQF
ncbi:epsin [Microdochium nivale]|nr:epsin [Microdochium nivale]